MSDSPDPTPAEVTASSVVTAPHAPSDSAPPPVPVSPSSPLPARTYSARPIAVRPPPAYAPNSSVPNFIRLLATLLFLGGSVSAAVAWFYKTVVVPRLILALKARTKLFEFHSTKYGELWRGLKQFGESTACERLGGKQALELRRDVRERDDTVHIGKEGGLQNSGNDAKDSEEEKRDAASDELERVPAESTEARFVAPRLVEPLVTSLSSLHTSISTSSTPVSKSNLGTNPSNLVQPQGQLMRSFVTFNEYLDSELHSISTTATNPYRTYGTSSVSSSGATGGTSERKALQEATQGFKAEIRSIKGALLNRRNFVRPEIATAA